MAGTPGRNIATSLRGRSTGSGGGLDPKMGQLLAAGHGGNQMATRCLCQRHGQVLTERVWCLWIISKLSVRMAQHARTRCRSALCTPHSRICIGRLPRARLWRGATSVVGHFHRLVGVLLELFSVSWRDHA